MLRLTLRRLALSIPLALVASMISFVLIPFLPGDAARALAGPTASAEQLAAIREELGLNLPLWEQYWNWLTAAVRGDLGTSLISRQPVTEILNSRLEPSLSLIIGATLVAAVVGVAMGVRAARRGVLGRVVDSTSLVALAIPDFWLGLVLVVVFAVQLGWLPPTGYVSLGTDPGLWLQSLVLPVVTLSLPALARVAKQTRDSMGTALDGTFVRTLRAAAIPEWSITYRHALRNAAVPILTVIGLVFVGALSGTVAVESIFAIPGLGSAAVQATSSRDLPLIQGVVVYFTVITIVVNLLVDLAYGYFNPRVRVK
ncbi:ABC transporter permease [Rathayibacter caricis DSM 15933]|uniref:ABC transporter permease n=1 Tax=Rathayibacter caricis DSM 15933 TaxID=1328867 RepID=A0A2T4USD3_9MICO|nr:ABC transporter permease [Rathayibacter caricis DSM 15933]